METVQKMSYTEIKPEIERTTEEDINMNQDQVSQEASASRIRILKNILWQARDLKEQQLQRIKNDIESVIKEKEAYTEELKELQSHKQHIEKSKCDSSDCEIAYDEILEEISELENHLNNVQKAFEVLKLCLYEAKTEYRLEDNKPLMEWFPHEIKAIQDELDFKIHNLIYDISIVMD